MFSHIVEDVPYYTSSISVATNDKGILFVAAVINPPGGIDTQYCVIKRIDTTTGENRDVARLWARDSRSMILSEGGDPNLTNGKYGNVAIGIHGDDIKIVLEMRYDNINKQRWGVLKGKGI